MSTLSDVINIEYTEGDIAVNNYINSKKIYLCDCGKGEKIKNNCMYMVVESRNGYCVHCHYAVIERRVPKNWLPSMGLFKLQERMRGEY